eukprot:Pgem_evm1s18456
MPPQADTTVYYQTQTPGLLDLCNNVQNADERQTQYMDLHSKEEEERKSSYENIVNSYYDMCTDFYEYGWGQSFHFAPQAKSETFEQALMRHEHILASKLNMQSGEDKKYLDVGCGVGGPLRAVSRFSGANVVGLNNNEYQVSRARHHTKLQGLEKTCSFVKGDFHHMPFPDNSFDGVYAVEATCHAKVLTEVYSEVFRVLKPGAKFVFYEWAMTDKYDDKNEQHRKIKKDIEIGNGIPIMQPVSHVLESVKKSGFILEECFDAVDNNESVMQPWYSTLQGGISLTQFRHTTMGRKMTHAFVTVGEKMGLIPKGTTDVHTILLTAADSLIAGGVQEIFTPMLRITCTKPLE